MCKHKRDKQKPAQRHFDFFASRARTIIKLSKMTTSSSLSGGKLSPKPPAKGSFPLDHLSECRQFAKTYHECLQSNDQQTSLCRKEARRYLECRMHCGLMAVDEWHKLGLSRDDIVDHSDRSQSSSKDSPSTAEQAHAPFVAGLKTAQRRKARARSSATRSDGEA